MLEPVITSERVKKTKRLLSNLAILLATPLSTPWNAWINQRLRWQKHQHGEALQTSDLFIVTSCTNPFDSDSNVNHNYGHSQCERAKELASTLRSVRYFYPRAIVVVLENSSVEPGLARDIKEMCDQRMDYSKDAKIKFSRTFKNKGIPWLAKLLKFLDEEGDCIRAERLHIICGRYELSDNIMKNKKAPGAYFKYYPAAGNVSTRYICYNEIRASEVRRSLRSTLSALFPSRSVEDVIHGKGVFRKHYLNRIGIKGTVNGIQLIEE